eukprot:12400318-Karenia_brevis.AAC.1
MELVFQRYVSVMVPTMETYLVTVEIPTQLNAFSLGQERLTEVIARVSSQKPIATKQARYCSPVMLQGHPRQSNMDRRPRTDASCEHNDVLPLLSAASRSRIRSNIADLSCLSRHWRQSWT